ncbi:MAG: hypothetical protein K6356_15780 [Chloroflexus sp.]
MSRHIDNESGWQAMAAVITLTNEDTIGIKWASDKSPFPATRSVKYGACAQVADWCLTTHTCATTDAEHVRQTITALAVEQRRPGTRAIGNPAVLQLMADHSIAAVLPTSDRLPQTVPDSGQHRLPQLLHSSLCMTDNNDPGPRTTDLTPTHRIAHHQLGLTSSERDTVQTDALVTAFIGEAAHTRLQARARMGIA